MLDTPTTIDQPPIVVTASRAPQAKADNPASTTILNSVLIERLGEPQVTALLRLVPSVAVATSGPAGSQAQVRIRGAEANHTLLFIDGVRANDPAAGNEPRFELLNADLASRIEVVRGPQSALWGSEAIGGVVAVDGAVPSEEGRQGQALAEAGSFGSRRTSASIALASPAASLALGVGLQRAAGIDGFDGTGDRDGYRNASARLRATAKVFERLEIGAAGFGISANNEFDGYDPASFLRADTADSSRNRLAAGRLWAGYGGGSSPLSLTLSASLLGSSNRNRLDGTEINRTRASRRTVSGQAERRFDIGASTQKLILAIEAERETFHARDFVYGGATNQDRTRRHDSLTAEWRAELGKRLSTDIALRHDRFNRFKDATSLRAGALVHAGSGIGIGVNYADGIAQPTFFDLYGFFPGSFRGNPSLAPETSRGVEAAVRVDRRHWDGSLAVYRQRLRGEIVSQFDSATFLSTAANAAETSHRQGVEASVGWKAGETLRVAASYALLDARERPAFSATNAREVRRPRHSGSITVDGRVAQLTYGASLAYVGARRDVDFDRFPAANVRLGSYWLAGANLAFALTDGIEAFGRVSNLLDKGYQDVVGYRTEGRSIHGGVRLALGR